MQDEPQEGTVATQGAATHEESAGIARSSTANTIEIENSERAMTAAKRNNAVPSSNEIQISLLGRLSQETINKISRLVAKRRVWGNTGSFIADEIRHAYEQRTALIATGQRQVRHKGDEAVLAGKLRLIETRIATWKAQQDDIESKRSAAFAMTDNLLKTVRQELGGGEYGEEIFDVLGWRSR